MEVPKAVLAENPELADSYASVSPALCSLGHALHAWSQHLNKWFWSKGYVSLNTDSCLYVLYGSTGHVQAAAVTLVLAAKMGPLLRGNSTGNLVT